MRVGARLCGFCSIEFRRRRQNGFRLALTENDSAKTFVAQRARQASNQLQMNSHVCGKDGKNDLHRLSVGSAIRNGLVEITKSDGWRVDVGHDRTSGVDRKS